MQSSSSSKSSMPRAAGTVIVCNDEKYLGLSEDIRSRLQSHKIVSDIVESFIPSEFVSLADTNNIIVLSGGKLDERLHRYIDNEFDDEVHTIWIFNEPYDDEAEATLRSEYFIKRVENWSYFQPSFIDDIVAEISQSSKDTKRRLESVINTFADESDDERLRILEDIKKSPQSYPGLPTRLRDEISGSYGVHRQKVYESSEREEEVSTAVRSWMMSCLVAISAEDPRTKSIALRHLKPGYDPSRYTRFWTLSGLHLVGAAYLEEACKTAFLDDNPEVNLLARAILERFMPGSTSIWAEFQNSLYSEDFATVRSVLRVLRVVPNTQLIDDIYKQIGRRPRGGDLTYDALYALASHVGLQGASGRLSAEQVTNIAQEALRVSQSSNDIGKRKFAGLLDDLGTVATSEIRRLSRDDVVAGQILRHINQRRHRAGAADHDVIAGFSSDRININNDYLGISAEVKSLSSVVMAREVIPPIAIGLFGGWGTGKSFFIKKMQAETKRIADREKQKPTERYCSNIVSIEFNAWHYIDANLWASLVSHIIDSLARALSTNEEDPEKRRVSLVSELKTTQQIILDIEAEKSVANTLLSEKHKELTSIRSKLEEKELKLSDLKISDVKAVFAEDAALCEQLKGALKGLGVPAAISSAEDLKKAADDVVAAHGRAGSLLAQISKAGGGRIYWALIIFIVALPFIASFAYQWISSLQVFSASFIEMSGVMLSVSATLTAIATYLKKVSTQFNSSIDKFEKAKKLLDDRLAAKRADIGANGRKLESEIKDLQAKELDAANRLNAASTRVADIEEKLRAIQQEGSLAKFLSDRLGADDYRKHLGIISTVRQDFEDLSRRLLATKASVEGEPALQGVDRIFLYIDDLDRCPAENVVAVLQAVHLLLAFELFVVVVGVDPSWLKNSLKTQYSQIGLQPNGGAVIAPQKYIEKIFQIPVRLKPMSEMGYGRLVRGLLRPGDDRNASGGIGTPAVAASANQKSAVASDPNQSSQGYVTTSYVGKDVAAALGAIDPDALPTGLVTASKEPPEVAIEALTITVSEAEYAEQLFLLMPNPRAAKRFTNIYRILKASVPASELNQFEGTSEVPGHFCVIMLLLALSTAFPSATASLLRDIVKASQEEEDCLSVIRKYRWLKHKVEGTDALETQSGGLISVDDIAELVRQALKAPVSISSAACELWADRISGFSFDL